MNIKASLTLLLLAALMAFQPLSAGAAPPSAVNPVTLYKQHDFKGAAAGFEARIKANPRDSVSCYYAGLCYQQLGNMSRAILMYRQVVKLSPGTKLSGYAGSILKKVDRSYREESKKDDDVLKTSLDDLIDGAKQSDKLSEIEKKDQEDAIEKDTRAYLPDFVKVYFTSGRGGMSVPVKLNGREVKMIFDTGAPTTCISKRQLQNMGIAPPSGESYKKAGGSAGVGALKVWKMPASVQVGNLIRPSFHIDVLEYNSAEPLLGQDFFKDFDYTIDAGEHSILFRKKGSGSNFADEREAVPFRFWKKTHRIVVDVEVNGKKHSMMMDTGNSAAAVSFMTLSQVKDCGLQMPKNPRIGFAGGIDGYVPVFSFPVNSLKLGPVEKRNIMVMSNYYTDFAKPKKKQAATNATASYSSASKASGKEDDDEVLTEEGEKIRPLPLLGKPFFEGWKYSIDMKKKLIYLRRL